jgi:EAL domain-containing protein (putative c-di-GMP-specific phosphodiesterase class I)
MRPGAPPVTVTGPTVRRSLDSGGLRILMQPIVDLRSGEVRQFEALARLVLGDRPDEPVDPQQFLPLLDDEGVDLLLREAVGRALSAVAGWEAQGLHLTVSVNLAPSSLRHPHCADWVATLLDRHAVSADRLVLELLEDDVIDSPRQIESLDRLRGLGVTLALDDFGTAHSDPERLALLPAEIVKLDRAFTVGPRSASPHTRDAVTELIELSWAAGCQVVMEGIEHAGQAELARALGADLGQGYYFARPMPVDDVPAWVAAHPARPAQRGASG